MRASVILTSSFMHAGKYALLASVIGYKNAGKCHAGKLHAGKYHRTHSKEKYSAE
jgi:hypothetical protein